MVLSRSDLSIILAGLILICPIIFGFDISICPIGCICLGQFIDCSNKSLSMLPYNIPSWVTHLDMTNNDLNSANISEQLGSIKEITELKLGQNSLTTIPIKNKLMNLTTLKVPHNKLNESSFSVLNHLPSLRDLDMSTNLISQISIDMIPNTTTLRTLNLNNNKLTTIEKGSLDPVSKLTDLKLARNHLRSLNKDVFKNLTSLKTLDLSRNRFSKIEGLSFTGLKSLSVLKLKSNSIHKLEDGAFYGLDSLTSLYLNVNNINEVTKNWLYGLEFLQQLFLSHNKIHTLDSVWDVCVNLEELDLSYNILREINRDTLQHLSKLKTLKMNHNQISYIAEGAFNHTPALVELQLNGNKISWTIEDMPCPFVGLRQLRRLSLAHNAITSVSEQALVGLDSLVALDLSANRIKTIAAETLSHAPSLWELRLNATSLVCDCTLSWLPAFLAARHTDSAAACAYPTALRGRLVTSVPQMEFLCSPGDFPKPQIVEEPRTQVAMSGGNVTLRCGAVSSSDAPLAFKWRRDNRDVGQPTLQSLGSGKPPTHASHLVLANVTLDASALYQCIVSNDFGTVYSHKANLSVYTFPRLLKMPANVTTKAGSMARLECAASGHPTPQIGWQKDGGTDFPAAQERRVHVMPTDDVFFIVNVKPVDSGVYSCTANNVAGSVVANASLNVVEPPSFVKKMEDREVRAGEAIVLECMAAGSPKPALRWTKDGGSLHVTDRHFFTAEDQLLIIMETQLSDSGLYGCEMTNSLGTNRGTAQLTVTPVYDSVNDEDMTGVIIITVVCCAVGTSIVWVIIIYQTRKRLNGGAAHSRRGPHVLPLGGLLDNKSEHSSSSKDSGTGDSTKRSHEDLLLETVGCAHHDSGPSGAGVGGGGGEVTLPLLTSFHPYGETAAATTTAATTAVYKVPCCCQTEPTRTDHDRQPSYLCVPVYLPSPSPPHSPSPIPPHSSSPASPQQV